MKENVAVEKSFQFEVSDVILYQKIVTKKRVSEKQIVIAQWYIDRR